MSGSPFGLLASGLFALGQTPVQAPLDTYDNAWVVIGPVSVGPDEAVQSLVAVGPITIAGNVFGDVVSVGGKVTIAPTALVAGNVTALCGYVEVAEGAKVLGTVRANELALVRVTPLTPAAPAEAALILGDHEFIDPRLRQAIVIGGNALVRATSGLTEIIALGGDVRIEAGPQVSAARVFGGQLTRVAPRPEAQDERAEPMRLRFGGRLAAESSAVARLTSSFERDRENLKLAAFSERSNTGEAHLAAFAPSSRVELTLAVKQANRSPLSAGQQPGQWLQFGEGWASWPKRSLDVPADADPLLQQSAALGVALRIDATIETPGEPRRNLAQRTLTLGIPADAEGLLEYRDRR
ncbi:MAG: polymer-forming cytoskeletal protein [Armatimonadetes bacterium]|nr:polymer-forming cytoskeletal protein [Armatimonadota bacterium]